MRRGRTLMISTPYFVPNEAMQAALCAAAHRGVVTTIIFPARNDSRQVAATSRSYYQDLVEAGVKMYELFRRSATYQVGDRGR